jgi:predicted ATPase/DNA-binding SARP family transcriptional activator
LVVDAPITVNSSHQPLTNESALRIHLLGSPEVTWAGQPVALSRRQSRALLYRLTASPVPIPRDELCFLFWPDIGESEARRNLTVLLNHLRRELPRSDIVATVDDAIDLQRAFVWTDLGTLHVTSDSALLSQSVDDLHATADLYRGPFLHGFGLPASAEFDIWLAHERQTWERRYLAILAALVERHANLRDYSAAADAAQRFLATNNHTEDIHRRLIWLYAALGDRAAAMQQFDACADVLEHDLNLSPSPETWALFEVVRAGKFSIHDTPHSHTRAQVRKASSPARQQHYAPLPTPVNPLLGREGDVAAACDRLRSQGARLLTLTGSGGSGKTRLTLAVAAQLQGDGAFADGVAFVSLASLREPSLLMNAIAKTLGVSEAEGQCMRQALVDAIHDRHLLLVLDNFEHVSAAAADVAALLAHAPRLFVLATSRTALNVSGEYVQSVHPLPLPTAHASIEDLTAQPATALLVARIRAHTPSFAVTSDNAADLIAICARLDGLPLALELAAARLKVLSLPALCERLDASLALLTDGPRDLPERQQMLRATIDWSYQLLAPPEQRLLARLSVFSGGWSLDACLAIGGSIQGLANLIDNSLIQRIPIADGDGEVRFSMLETVREFAKERLAHDDEASHVHRAHAAHLLSLAQQADVARLRPERERWLERLEAEHDNLRAALDWSIASDAHLAIQLAACVWPLWYLRGHLSEGRAWLTRVLGRANATSSDDAHPAAQADLATAQTLFGMSRLTWAQRGYAEAQPWAEASLNVFQALGSEESERGVADCLNLLGEAAMERGDFAQASALHQRTLALSEALGDEQRIAQAQFNLGDVAILLGQYDRAEAHYERSLALMRALGDTVGVANALYHLGKVAHYKSDFALAAQRYAESLALHHDAGNRRNIALLLIKLGEVLCYRGQAHLGAEMFEDAASLCRELGYREGLGMATYNLAYEAFEAGDSTRAEALNAESRAMFEALGIRWGVSLTLGLEGVLLAAHGNLQQAWRAQTRCLNLWRELKSPRGTVITLNRLGELASAQGNPAEAERLLRQSLADARRCEDRYSIAISLEGLASAQSGLPDLLAQAAALREDMGAPLRPSERERIRRASAVHSL